MNKTKLSINIICVLTLAIMIFSSGIGLVQFVSATISGFPDSEPTVEEETLNTPDLTTNKLFISSWVKSDNKEIAVLDVQDSKQTSIPVSLEKISIGIDADKVGNSMFLTLGSLIIVSAILSLVLVIVFTRLVIRINYGHIFDDRNVKLLRNISIILFLMSAVEATSVLIEYHTVTSTVGKIGQFTPTLWPSLPWANTLFALLALMMAFVWKRGLALKQDNELTI